MDPLSVLGATAASSQLLQQGAKITKFLWDLHSKMKNSPETIHKEIVQIEQLIDLSRLFLQSPSLQKDSVASILGTCLLRAQEFDQELQKVSVHHSDGKFKKLKKTFEAVMKEKEIVQLFDQLEREKSSLMLCIQQIDNTLLHTINIDIKDIQTGLDDMVHVVRDTAHDMTTVVNTLPGMSAQVTEIHTVVKTLQNLTFESQRSADSTSQTSNYYIVPNRRVRQFIGREDVLARIGSAFSLSLDQAPQIVTIRGLGGQGKTQVTLEYCRRAKNSGVRAIFWVDAMSKSSVQKSFETISESIKDPGQILQDDARVRFVIEKLENLPDQWILVFDNHDDPSAFNLQDYIPEEGRGWILITSRHADVDSLTDPENAIELQGLLEKEALDLLFKQSRVKMTESNLHDGKLIVERLGYHALAIAQAGSYVNLRKIEFRYFIDHYNRQKKDILQQTPQMSQYRRKLSDTADETVLTVFTTWELSFQLLQAQETLGIQKAEILTLFAFFDSRDISEQLFKVYCDEEWPSKDSEKFGERLMASLLDDKDTWNHEAFVQILVNLTQMSLVQAWSWDENEVCHFNLHPLIRDWIRLRTDTAAFQDYSRTTADILKNLLRSCYHQNIYELPLSSRLAILPHADAHKENIESLKIKLSTDTFSALYSDFEDCESWLSDFLEQAGNLAKAEEVGRRLVTWYETKFGLENTRNLNALNNLALVLQGLGKYEEAEEMHQRALQSREKVLGPEHPDTLNSINNLGSVLQDLGKYEEAEEMHQRALQSREKVLGPEHPDTLNSINNLAILLQGLGKYEEAEEMHQRALQSREKVLGPEHPDTLNSINNLAIVLRVLGRYEEAEEMHRRTLQSREKVLGPEHPDTLNSINNLGSVLQDLGKYEEAEEMHQRALQSNEKVLGPKHPNTLNSINNLGSVLQDLGKYEEAEEMYRRTLQSREKVLRPEHPDTLNSINNLGSVLQDLGKYEEAEEMHRRALQSREKVLGPEHPNTLNSINNLGSVLQDLGKYEEAEEMHRRALQNREKVLGPRHRDTLSSLWHLASLLEYLERFDEALAYYQRAFLGCKKVLGEHHPDTLRCGQEYSMLLEQK